VIESDSEDADDQDSKNVDKLGGDDKPDSEDKSGPNNKSVSDDSGSNEKPVFDDKKDGEGETDLTLAVPYRKTARKSLKRKNDVEQLQEKKIKKLKENDNESKKSSTNESPVAAKSSPAVEQECKTPEKESLANKSTDSKASVAKSKKKSPESKTLTTKKETKTSAKKPKKVSSEVVSKEESPEPMDCEDSPVKKKSKRNRIVSDSEDDSPKKEAKESPIKEEKTSSPKVAKNSPKKEINVVPKKENLDKSSSTKKTFNIFAAAKKSPTKKEPASPNKSPAKNESSSPKKLPKEEKPESPKPSTSGTSKPKNAFAGFLSSKGSPGSTGKDDGNNYDKIVKKIQYHPINDCFWKKGEKTPYLALCNTLLAIEETSGRLRTIEMLSNYFRSVMVQTPEDLLPSIYMILNRLAPAWEGTELGIGDHLLMKAIAQTTGRSTAQVKADVGKLGDLGIVAESSKGSQRTMFQPAPLTVAGVFSRLKDVAAMTGSGGGNKKVEKIQSVLVACRGSEARYFIRSLAGKMRIGLAEQSVLQALAQACLQTPLLQAYPPPIHTAFKSADNDAFKEKLGPLALKLKTAYCECPSYDILVPALFEAGIDGLPSRCKLTPGIPLKPMLAHPTKGVQEVLTRFENCKFTCEWKYDGERAQLHLHEDGRINIFSRNQEDNTTKYPDIIQRFQACLTPAVKSLILDCEAVAWDREKKSIQPFQVLSTRKRKDAVESEIKVQVCLFGFDLLYLNGERMVNKNFLERRNLLRENLKEVEGEFYYAKGIDGTSSEQIQEALEDSIKDNCEGLMVKTLDHEATYEIARRSHNWLKLKKDYLDGVGDTMDLVVLGGFLGKGKRVGGYGGFLLGCYDPENEEYQSICKIGTGFTDENLQKHAAFFKDHVIPAAKGYYSFDAGHTPDHWFEPVQVWEVKCADMTVSPVHKAAMGIVDPNKGISLRFPRFITIREDKNPEDATSAEQIAEMYNNQDQIKNQNKNKGGPAEDDFDF